MPERDMSISAFSRRTMLSIKALRLYDEVGLLRPAHTDQSSGYRYYRESQIATARQISLLRQLGVPLNEIREMIALASPDAATRLTQWWRSEEETMTRRRDLYQFINASVLGSADTAQYDIATRSMPEVTYLVISAHLHGPDLPTYIDASEDRLRALAEPSGGATGPLTVVFRGAVDLDSNGPVDVCLPVAPDAPAPEGILKRVEAPHAQAFVTLTRPQIAFPQILQVYQAIRVWIAESGHEITGWPREIYIGDFAQDAPNEPICEVAFPISNQENTTI